MIKLIIALVVSFLVVIFYFFGVKWGLGISIGLFIAAPFVSFAILKIAKNKTGGTPTSPGTIKYGSLGIWLLIAFVVFATWGIVTLCDKMTRVKTVTDSTIQPKEEWIFVWHLPPNQYDRGRNGDTLEARIVKNDSESLWFDTVYRYAGSMEVGRTQLSKNGNRLVGSWSQDNPMDGGSIYMDKVGNQMWVGQSTDRTGRTYPCTLKRK